MRKRPLNSREVQEDVLVVWSYNYMTLYEPRQRVDTTKYMEKHHFMFDEVFNEEDNNEEVYAQRHPAFTLANLCLKSLQLARMPLSLSFGIFFFY